MEVIPDELPIGDARANLSEVLNAVRLQDRMVTLARRGTPQGVVLPPDFKALIEQVGGINAARAALRAQEPTTTATWSVVRGESPTARAVEPGPHGIAVPDEVLAWAEGHGLNPSDPDVYLLVTLGEEVGVVPGEIDYMEAPASAGDAARIRTALAELG